MICGLSRSGPGRFCNLHDERDTFAVADALDTLNDDHGVTALPRISRWPQGMGHRDCYVVGEPGYDLDRVKRYLLCFRTMLWA